MLGSTAKQIADTSASSAVVAVLAPICVEKFQLAAGADANLAELKKVSSWQQGTFVEKGVWVIRPGQSRLTPLSPTHAPNCLMV
jgi:hypothetical protein